MSDRPAKRRILWYVIGALLLVPVGYVGWYLALSRTDDYPDVTYHTFRSRFECHMFRPLGWFECRIRRTIVVLEVPTEHDPTGHLHDGPVVVIRP